MPRAFDRVVPTTDRSQLVRKLRYDIGDWEEEIKAAAVKAEQQFFNQIINSIQERTGVDLQVWITLVNEVIASLQTILGDLTPGGGFNPEGALMAAIGLIQTIAESSPDLRASIQELVITAVQTFFAGFDLSPTANSMLGQILAKIGKGGSTLDDWASYLRSLLDWPSLDNLRAKGSLGHVAIGHIGDFLTNLVDNPLFEDLESIVSSVFSFDPTQYHVAPGGSAKVIADGSGSKDLLSNLVGVVEGQVINLSAWLKYAGLTGTGPLMALGVTGYLNGDATDQTDVATQNNVPSTSDWRQLSGTYTVPSNVDSIRLRLTMYAATTSGTAWWDDTYLTKAATRLGQHLVENLEDDLSTITTTIESQAAQMLSFIETGDWTALLNTLGGDLTAIGTRLAGFLTGSSSLNADKINAGQLADEFVPGIGTLVDNIVVRLHGWTGSGHSQDDAATALGAQADAVTGMAADIALLKQTFTSGVSDGDDFERTSSTGLGSRWLVYTSASGGGGGVWATPDGHDASWAKTPLVYGTVDFVCILNDGNIRSATDNQIVAQVLGAAATQFALAGVYDYCGHNDVWLRISDATAGFSNITGIRVRFSGDGGVSITRFVNGISTDLDVLPPGSINRPGPGATLIGESGEPGTGRIFKAYLNSTQILDIPEVGTASGYGGAYRRWGIGGRAEGHLLPIPGQESPGKVYQVTMTDQ